MSVIGAGFGRTGTLSLKLALEQLGFGPCYHMNDVFTRAGHAQRWRDAFRSGAADWESLLNGYRAAVDWPSAHFWRQLAGHCPTVRVILTVRDPGAWCESIRTTIFPAQRRPLPPPDDPHYAQLVMPGEMILHGTFGQIEDKAHVLSTHDAHNAAVQAQIAPQRLLLCSRTAGRRCASSSAWRCPGSHSRAATPSRIFWTGSRRRGFSRVLKKGFAVLFQLSARRCQIWRGSPPGA
ncbi:sulfotransferase family protein [Immundisolibacter sp.]